MLSAAIGGLTVAFACYVGMFVVIERSVSSYEREHILEMLRNGDAKPGVWRTIYNSVFAPLRWLKANRWSATAPPFSHHFGWAREIADSRIVLTRDDGMISSMGFTAGPDALSELARVKRGDYLKVTLGVELRTDGDRFINRLVHVDVIDVGEDPRIHPGNYSTESRRVILKAVNGLAGEPKRCSDEFLAKYARSVKEHCEKAGYAEEIEGGCDHVVGYAVHTAVLAAALKSCGAFPASGVASAAE